MHGHGKGELASSFVSLFRRLVVNRTNPNDPSSSSAAAAVQSLRCSWIQIQSINADRHGCFSDGVFLSGVFLRLHQAVRREEDSWRELGCPRESREALQDVDTWTQRVGD